MNQNNIQYGTDRFSDRKGGHPSRPAALLILGLTIIGNSNMKQIPLTQGKFATVDDEDYDYLMQWKWSFSKRGYAVRRVTEKGVIKKQINMHRVIAKTPDDMFTDHRDENKLNNSRVNLRKCTKSQNGMNRGPREDNKSGYKGVWWCEGRKKWTSAIGFNGQRIHVGRFSCIVKAAKAYDEAAIKYHGQFANLNFKRKGVK